MSKGLATELGSATPAKIFPKLYPHEQYASYRRGIEQFTCDHAIYLGLCQLLCTHLGNHLKCREGACRRNGACAGIRDQDRFGIPLVLFPPCVPLDREIIETYRQEIIAELRRAGGKSA